MCFLMTSEKDQALYELKPLDKSCSLENQIHTRRNPEVLA